MRKKEDERYFHALEVGWSILSKHYGLNEETATEEVFKNRYKAKPDIWANNKSVCVVIGVLREDTLRVYLKHFQEVVHLPYPKTFDGDLDEPTCFRCFKRSRARSVLDSRVVSWGDSLIHGRSLRMRP